MRHDDHQRISAVRVAADVDGFNLYFGLTAKRGRRYHWLDLQAPAGNLLRPGQTPAQVTYFTAHVRKDPEGERRQPDCLHALESHCPLVTIVDGRFQQCHRRCRRCGPAWTVYEEKETDVNIAVALVEDAVLDRDDTALLISADSDLRPAIEAVRRLRPEKRIVTAFPPKREPGELRRAVDGYLIIGDDKLRWSQLPTVVMTPAGIPLHRPKHWS